MPKFDIKSVILGVGMGIIITSAAGIISGSINSKDANTVQTPPGSISERSAGIFTGTADLTGVSSETLGSTGK